LNIAYVRIAFKRKHLALRLFGVSHGTRETPRSDAIVLWTATAIGDKIGVANDRKSTVWLPS
jgi:hypothetical protein